jgi:dipeptidyl aminopeptidase/acylaminoacyl peptidase
MRGALLAALALSRLGAPEALTPELAATVRWPIEVALSPDGRRAAVTLRSADLETDRQRTELYLVSTATGERSEARRLTEAGRGHSEPAWSPDGRRLAFVSRRDDGPAQLSLLELDQGAPRAITDLAGGATSPVWSPDGKSIAFSSDVDPRCGDDACNRRRTEERDRAPARTYDQLFRDGASGDQGLVSHVFVVAADGSAPPRDLTPGDDDAPVSYLDGRLELAFVDDAELVVTIDRGAKTGRSTNHDLFLIRRSGGTLRQLTTHPAWDAAPRPSPPGTPRRIAYLAASQPGAESDRKALAMIDLESQKGSRDLFPGFDRSIEDLAWLPDGSGLMLLAQERGRLALFRAAIGGAAPAPAPEPIRTAEGSVRTFSVGAGGVVAFVASSFTTPPEVYLYDPEARSTRRLSDFNEALLAKLQLGAVAELSATRPGSKAPVHGFVVRPPAASARSPGLILIHGGPEGSWLDEWNPRWNPQIFAARGFVVGLPNPAGSLGYGQRFSELAARDWGGAPYADVLAFTEALSARPDVDGARISAAGASYGGYLIAWIAGHSDRFRCLISHAGLFNLESFWGHTDELWFPEWEFGGSLLEHRADYRRWSPHLFVRNAKTPTLLMHGAEDHRVPLSESLQFFTALKSRGVPARLVVFPDEGHRIEQPKALAHSYWAMLHWLDEHGH